MGAGADVESKNNIGRTPPLSFAASSGHLEVVEFLVEEGGADVESKDYLGWTVLDLARQAVQNSWRQEEPKALAAWPEKERRSTNHRSCANANDGI